MYVTFQFRWCKERSIHVYIIIYSYTYLYLVYFVHYYCMTIHSWDWSTCIWLLLPVGVVVTVCAINNHGFDFWHPDLFLYSLCNLFAADENSGNLPEAKPQESDLSSLQFMHQHMSIWYSLITGVILVFRLINLFLLFITCVKCIGLPCCHVNMF